MDLPVIPESPCVILIGTQAIRNERREKTFGTASLPVHMRTALKFYVDKYDLATDPSAFATIVGFALISAVSFVEPTPFDLPTYDAKLNYLASGCDACLRLDVLDAITLLHPIELLSTASTLGRTNRAGGGGGWHDGAFVSPALWHELVSAFCRRGGDDGAGFVQGLFRSYARSA